MFKLAIFDLDGTLLNSKKEITPRTLEAVMNLQRQGVRVALASGRPTYGIVPIAEQLQLGEFGGYILSFNGGVVVECSTMEIVASQTLDKELIPILCERVHQQGCEIISYDNSKVVTEQLGNKYIEYEAMLNRMTIEHTDSFLERFNHPVPKCLAVGEPERAIALMEGLQAELGGVMSIYRSEPFFVELVPLGIDKAQSLESLGKIIGIEREEMISFGDGFNDLSMIEWAGCGVAMANAQEQVRSAANAITTSNEEDGVAEFIERELLRE